MLPWRRFLVSHRVELGFIALCAVGHLWLAGWWVSLQGAPWVSRTAPPYYGLQTEALVAGRAYLSERPRPELAQLANPYSGEQNRPYRVLDLSYFHGRYYLYFGLTPVLVLLLPWRLLTGLYLTDASAAVGFSAAACWCSLGLLVACRRRFFFAVPRWAPMAAAAVLAFGNLQLVLLQVPSVYQVAQLSGYAALQLSLVSAYAALTCASWRRSLVWLAAASLGCGAAFLARPSFLPTAGLLAILAWFVDRRRRAATGAGFISNPWGVLAAAGGPLAACGALAAAWNWIRFGSFTEFGNRYQLSDLDLRHLDLFSFRYAARNVGQFLFAPPRLGPYFPYVGAGLAPIGLLAALPFAWLAAGLLGASDRRLDPRLAWLGAIVAAVVAGTFLPLAAYFAPWSRYEIDFFVPWMVAAALGWLTWLSVVRGWLRTLVLGGGMILAAISISISLGFAGRETNELTRRFAGMARIGNLPAAARDWLEGSAYGPIRLQVTFPPDDRREPEPILQTGWQDRDLITVKRIDPTQVIFQWFHPGAGGPVSDPVPIAPGSRHTLVIAMGSLFPPAEHPFFAQGEAAAAVFRWRHRLAIQVDGRTVLSADGSFYESGPGDVRVGQVVDCARDLARPAFSGSIVALGRQQVDARLDDGWPRDRSPIAIELRFPNKSAGANPEPLLSTGAPGHGDLVFVEYLPRDRIRIGYNHGGGGSFRSEPTMIEPGERQRLQLWMPSIGRDAAGRGRWALSLGRRSVVDLMVPFFPTTAGQVAFGYNAVQSEAAAEMFSGTILTVTRARTGAELEPWATGSGPLELRLRFSSNHFGTAQPLVATGRTGAADIVYVIPSAAGTVRFGFDHWSMGGPLTAPIAVDLSARHTVEIESGCLWGPAANAEQRATVRVRCDGRVVLTVRTETYPTRPEEIRIGENRVGASSCGRTFFGELISVQRRP
jgi:hypothetical protein